MLPLLLLAQVCAQEQPAAPELVCERETQWAHLLGASGDYEASGITRRGDELWVVFDDDGRLARTTPELEQAELFGEKEAGKEYEGICWDPRGERFWIAIESRATPAGPRPVLRELDRELTLVRDHPLPIALDGANKGVEGLAWLRRGESSYLLALMEGNHGSAGAKGKEPGHGRVHVLRIEPGRLEGVTVLALPAVAAFEDYAGLAVDDDGRLAVVSQSNSALWVGRLVVREGEDGREVWETEPGQVYRFPTQDGQVVYGNVEGVVWLDAQRLTCVSDKPKAKHPEHAAKGESIHVFRLP